MKLLRLFWLAPMLGLFIQCKKITDIQHPPLLDTTLINAMYPVTRSYTDGGYFRSYKYEYNNDHHLSKYTLGNTVTWTVGTNQVDVTINEYASSNQELIHISTTSYVYTLAGVPTNTSVNIYNTAPTHVAWTYYDKDMPNGVTKSRPGGVSEFFTNKEGLPFKILDNNTNNQNYTYNANGNLEKIEIVRLSGPRVGELFARINFLSFDNKPSPFSVVKGYWPASYPQGDNWEYALAFCKNNPKQTTTELYDVKKNAFVTNQVDDYSYVYNDKGYPTQISINTTYYNAVTTHYSRTYTYTYK